MFLLEITVAILAEGLSTNYQHLQYPLESGFWQTFDVVA
jgi:hypothetical protein